MDEAALRVLRVIVRGVRHAEGRTIRRRCPPRLGPAYRGQRAWSCSRTTGCFRYRPGGRLAVIGRAAKEPRIQGGGSSQITPTRVDVPIDELAHLARDAEVVVRRRLRRWRCRAARPRRRGGRGRGRRGRRHRLHRDADDPGVGRRRPDGPGPHAAACCAADPRSAASQPRTIVVLFNGSAVSLTPWIGWGRRRARSVAVRAGRRRGGRRHPVRSRQPVGPTG